jgi:hypothetical protein
MGSRHLRTSFSTSIVQLEGTFHVTTSNLGQRHLKMQHSVLMTNFKLVAPMAEVHVGGYDNAVPFDASLSSNRLTGHLAG